MTTSGGIKNGYVYSLAALKAGSLKSRCLQGWFPVEALSLLQAFLNIQHHWSSLALLALVDASPQTLPPSLASFSASVSSPLVRKAVTGFRVHPK